MKCVRCGRNARFDLFFMGFLDYKLGYVLLECKLCHKLAFSLNMSNLSEISGRQIGGFNLEGFTKSQIAHLMNDSSLSEDERKAVLKEALIRHSEKKVTIASHDEHKGKEVYLEELFSTWRKTKRFINGKL